MLFIYLFRLNIDLFIWKAEQQREGEEERSIYLPSAGSVPRWLGPSSAASQNMQYLEAGSEVEQLELNLYSSMGLASLSHDLTHYYHNIGPDVFLK